MSEDEAWRRVTALRLARRFPRILGMIERGEIHLTALLLLSEDRYEVQFTATAELREKIEHATHLMRHTNPSGDLAVVLEHALDRLIAGLEKSRLGKTERPTASAPRKVTRQGYVRRAVRREVFERDGMQCTFVDETGQRCPSRAFLELDHRRARARGGSDEASNLRTRCRSHNALAAERDFGREYIERKIAARKSRSANPPRQRGQDSETALRALSGLGFKEQQVRRALGIIEQRPHDVPPSIETVVREALSLLT